MYRKREKTTQRRGESLLAYVKGVGLYLLKIGPHTMYTIKGID